MDGNESDLENGPSITYSSSKPKARLSCQLCHQRKVKCDKLNPCSNCRRTGATCVPVERQRLPRGRNRIHKNPQPETDRDLRERLGKLEQLVRNLDPGNASLPITKEAPALITSSHHSPINSTEQAPRSTASTEYEQNQSSASEDNTKHDETSTGGYLDSPFWTNVVHEVGYSLRRHGRKLWLIPLSKSDPRFT
jgi:hypothetical protein